MRALAVPTGLLLLLLTPVGAVAQGVRAQDVMIQTVPAPYELSPEEAGLTGPFDAKKAKQLGLPTEPFTSGPDVIEDSYLRVWIDPPQTSYVIALVFKATDDVVAAAMLNGAVDASEEAQREEFDVAIPDGRGFSELLPQDAGTAHSVFFRRGRYQAAVVTAGTRESSPDLVTSLAEDQFDRLPEGATSAGGPLSPAELGYRMGTIMAVAVQVAVVLGVIIWLVRRRRAANAPPHPGPNPALRHEEPTRMEHHQGFAPADQPPESDEGPPPVS
jgi:hypothetical protein